MQQIHKLINLLRNQQRIFIQTHDFPDPDAVASAFALQQLLLSIQIQSSIIYAGDMQRNSLKRMISLLQIQTEKIQNQTIIDSDKIIIVDGCKGNQNVSELPGEEIAVIDHHQVSIPEDVSFADIRPDIGSCSAIIYSYYRTLNIEPSKEAASAMLIGINTDTAFLTRQVSELDLEAFSWLYMRSDIHIVNSVMRNNLKPSDLDYFKYAIEHTRNYKKFSFCYFSQGCDQNLLGIIGDFLLSIDEIDFVALCAQNGETVNFSLRSENRNWDASLVIKDVLHGIGFGGGHMQMAGGVIKNMIQPNIQFLYERFIKSLGMMASGKE